MIERIAELEQALYRAHQAMELLQDRVEVLESDARVHETLLRTVRSALGDAMDAIDFAHTEGFEWPADPYTPAILKVCPPIRLGKAEPIEEASDV